MMQLAQEIPSTALMLDFETFTCSASSKNQRAVLKHYLEEHTREELADWSMGYDWIFRVYRYAT